MTDEDRQKIEEFGKFAWLQMREHPDQAVRMRYRTMHANVLIILNPATDDDHRREVLGMLGRNLLDLQLYQSMGPVAYLKRFKL
jgi:hypothetical protein